MKTPEEWSEAFDLYYNNIMSDKAPGLEPYEKGILLTRAQEGLVKDYFSAKTNQVLEGFDDSIRRQSDFKSLIVGENPARIIDTTSVHFNVRNGNLYYEYPKEAFLILNEEVKTVVDDVENFLTVVPLSYDEYTRAMKKPYKFPPRGLVWRLIVDGAIVLIGKFPSVADYFMRYVKRPKPIILETIPDSMPAIEGYRTKMTCELPEHLHDEIVQRAVLLAKVAWVDAVAPEAKTK